MKASRMTDQTHRELPSSHTSLQERGVASRFTLDSWSEIQLQYKLYLGGISVGAKKLYRSKMAANGQLVLPKELRDALDLAGGDVLIIQAEDQGNGLIEITIQRPRTNFRALIGQWSRKKGSKSVTVDDWSDDLKALDDEEMK